MAVKGSGIHSARLKRMRNTEEIARALYAAGLEIEGEAERSIIAGSITGKGHIPSMPGNPPNQNWGTLASNIETTIESKSPPTVHVTSHAPYSAFLEFGTSKMAPRPFMSPATQKKKGEAIALVTRAVSKLSK